MFQNFPELLKTIIDINLNYSDEIEKKEISFKEIIYTNLEKFKTVFEFQNIESDIPPALPNIFANEKLITNLVFNMLLFSFMTSDTKEKKIKISSFINLKGGICVKVWNNGENNLFKNEVKNILLENSFSKNRFLIQLFEIQKIVSIHKGYMSISSEFNKGSEISCIFPLK